MEINLQTDFLRFSASVEDLVVRQLPFAAARALTDTAYAVRDQITKDLPEIFDSPTPFTMRALAVTKATKADLTATVFVKDKQAQYLLPQEVGGLRTAAQNTRKSGTALVLPGDIPLNQFGNIPSGFLARLARQAAADAARRKDMKLTRKEAKALGKRTPRTNRDRGVFYAKGGTGPAHGKPGGYFRRLPGHKLQRLTDFAASQDVKPRFGFRARVIEAAERTFAEQMAKRYAEAVASAR